MAFNWLKKHFGKPGATAPETAAPEENITPPEEAAVVAEQPVPAPPAAAVEPAASEPVIAETLSEEAIAPVAAETTEAEPALAQPQTKPKNESGGYFARIRQGLAKTRRGFADLFLGKKTLDQDLIDDLETQLLTADVGIEVTRNIIDSVTAQIDRKELKDVEAVKAAVRDHMQQLLAPYAQPLDTSRTKPFVILMTGINGAGKTTTIGKLARYFQQEGKKVMLAAGDTFRAAAVEQLQTWGARHNVPVIAQGTGADAAFGGAVQFGDGDAVELHRLVELFGLAQGVLAVAGVDDEHGFVRRGGVEFGDDALDFFQFFHQVILGVQAAGGVDDEDVYAACGGGLQRVVGDGGGIGAGALGDDRDVVARAPGL